MFASSLLRLVVPRLLRGVVLLSALLVGSLSAQTPPAAPPATPTLTLTTTAFEDGGVIPDRFTQADPNGVSPALSWTHVPAGTVSFVLIMHDLDVALQKTTEDVLHWIAFNIPGTKTALPEGSPVGARLEDGTVQPKNRRGIHGYLGPGAPAPGPMHHYAFELFALDKKLDLTAEATRADVLKAMDGHIVGKGVLVGRFKRPTPAPAR